MVPSFEKRVRAFAIDTSGVTLVIILSSFLGTTWAPLPYITSGIAAFVFYFLPYFFSSGQTFGKRIQKIKVVTLHGKNVNVFLLILRDLLKLGLSVLTFGVYLIICYFVMNEKTSRTIHDYIFKTKMIDLEPLQGKNNYLGKSEYMRKRGF
jgi:uncharacterized RDD family membrane protein YckC